MRRIKSSYEFQETQVFTPPAVVELFWYLVGKKRSKLGSVVDLGAGDGRFSIGGRYNSYHGIEIDRDTPKIDLPDKATLSYGCAFEAGQRNWGAAIGNPPYIRHHYVELPWMSSIADRFRSSLGIELNRQANLFVYFLLLGLEITEKDGLVAMVTPYEWVSRPSAKPLRELIKESGWSVSVYRFKDEIFEGVMTTASISIIDKKDRSGAWSFYEIDSGHKIVPKRLASGSRYDVLSYEKRGKWWALRGLSPGTQKIFTLTEGERMHHGLSRDDVVPCVTSLMPLDAACDELNESTFKKYFRDAGQKCWLIRSDTKNASKAFVRYLDKIPLVDRSTSTCLNRDIWYQYTPFPAAQILIASAFTRFGPKSVRNSIGAHHVGSVYGVFGPTRGVRKVLSFLRKFNFEKRLISHSGKLKKVEVRQLNAVLNDVCENS